jgi:hypothetical protein
MAIAARATDLVRRAVDVLAPTPVDLGDLEPQVAQQAQRGHARAEIVQREDNARVLRISAMKGFSTSGTCSADSSLISRIRLCPSRGVPQRLAQDVDQGR